MLCCSPPSAVSAAIAVRGVVCKPNAPPIRAGIAAAPSGLLPSGLLLVVVLLLLLVASRVSEGH